MRKSAIEPLAVPASRTMIFLPHSRCGGDVRFSGRILLSMICNNVKTYKGALNE
jgi:hypothetical protein